jgi:MFS family permease
MNLLEARSNPQMLDFVRPVISIVRRSPSGHFISGSAFLALGGSIFGLLFNLYLYRLNYSQAFIGLLIALPAVASAAVAILLSFYGARVAYGPSLRAVALVSPVLTLLSVLFPSTPVLLLLTLPAGILGAWLAIVSGPLLTATTERSSRNLVFSLHFSLTLLASLFGSLLAGHLASYLRASQGLSETHAQRFALLVAVAAQALAIPFFFRLPKGSPDPGQSFARFFGSFREDWPLLRVLIVPNILISIGAGLLIPFFNLFFTLEFKIPERTLGNLFSLAMLSMALGGLSSGSSLPAMGASKSSFTRNSPRSRSSSSSASFPFSGFQAPPLSSEVC